MRAFQVVVTQYVTVELDETKFTEEFMKEFRENFYPFWEIEDHAEHIAQLVARGIHPSPVRSGSDEFIEGYGPVSEMGIAATVTDTTTEEVVPF